MAKILIDVKDKTKERILKLVRHKAQELGRKATLKEVVLESLGVKDE